MPYKGLTEADAEEKRKKYGENILSGKEKVSLFLIFLGQFKNPLVYVLLAVAGISLIFKENIDAVLISFVTFFNAIFGFFQEYKAQKTLVALRKILSPKATVIRDGKKKEIDAKELVVGDFVALRAGDKLPADGKIIESINLVAQEAILTGEEEGVEKTAQKEKNSVFMGTTIVGGRGVMEVLKIGDETEMGKISQSLAEIKEPKTPLQLKLEIFIKYMALLILAICVFVFAVGILFGQETWNMFKMAVVLSIAGIPEGLPAAITIILAIGMRRVLKKKGLVKRLLSMETLGSTSVICTDKTGTLTEGVMKVARAEFLDFEKARLALILANEQRSGLEISLWDYARENGNIDPQNIFDAHKRIFEEPFDSEKKYMMSVNKFGEKDTAFILGAPEIVLDFCRVSKEEKEKIIDKIEKWGSEGLRVLGVACKEDGGDFREKENFIWLGIVGIEDPIRPGVKEAIKSALMAGIKIKIVTGDYRRTAEKVAKNLGFDISSENVMEGKELEKISDSELKRVIGKIILFTRTTPRQKMKIIRVLQEKGEIVAMTGDGVNDAPALKKADIGVVVGNGTDVAKEAGDLILLDNNFSTIVAACEEGRLIFSNIKKVAGYVLANSFEEISLIFGALILRLPAPLTVAQILWINLICDGPPDVSLGFEPKENGLMEEKPRDIKKEPILDKYMKYLIFTVSLSTGALCLLFFWYFYEKVGDLFLARTIVFASAGSVSLIFVFAFKNLKKSIFHMENFFKNKFLFGGVAYGFVLIFVAVYSPFLNKALGTVPLKPVYWLLVLFVGLASIFWVEMIKIVGNHKK
ncbi:MAG: HAD-IC family P-type ATPase [Patescibacteria group bacterium]